MIHPLLFVGCFMFAVVLLAVGVIYSTIHWVSKAVLITASLAFTVLLYIAYISNLGYAARISPPPIFRFLYAVVQDPTDNDPGGIFLWIMERGQPRALRLHYTPNLRKLVSEAKRRVQEGQIVYLGAGADNDKKDHDQGGNGGGKSTSSSIGRSTVPYVIEGEEELGFKQPADTLPRKE